MGASKHPWEAGHQSQSVVRFSQADEIIVIKLLIWSFLNTETRQECWRSIGSVTRSCNCFHDKRECWALWAQMSGFSDSVNVQDYLLLSRSHSLFPSKVFSANSLPIKLMWLEGTMKAHVFQNIVLWLFLLFPDNEYESCNFTDHCLPSCEFIQLKLRMNLVRI